MKLAAYLHSTPPDRIVGGERMTLALLEHAQNNGHDVTLVVQTAFNKIEYAGMQIIPGADKGNSRQALAKADAIVVHPELSRQLASDNLVGIVHNLNAGTLEMCRRPERWKALVANSESTAKNLKTMGIRYTHIIKPPLIKPKTFTTRHEDFVFASNLSSEKGGDVFFECAKLLPNINFLGVQGGHGVQKTAAAQNIALVGHGPLDLAFSNTKIMLAPSRSETYGMTIAEATSLGIPVIASDIPAHREVLGKNGMFVRVDADIEEWAAAITSLIDDKDFMQKRKAVAYQRADELEIQNKQTFDDWISLLDML